ncbi:MAG: hypothetical protein IKM24_07380 [Clostridia bacterium]|nr:hypothetical protein [Clostridia bacterium]
MKLLDELTMRIQASELSRRVSLMRRRAEHKLEGTPTHLYVKCQCYCYDDNSQRMYARYGYMRLDEGGAVLSEMTFVDPQGRQIAFSDSPLRELSVKPVKGMLYTLRHVGTVRGRGMSGHVDTRGQNTLYCYTLDKNGKVLGRPSAVRNGEKLLEYNKLYLVTDNERTFAAYLQIGKNELWEFPVQ